MDLNRRRAIQGAVGALLAAAAQPGMAQSPPERATPIRMMIPEDWPLGFNADYPDRLAQATYDYLAENYTRRNLPLWNRPFEEIDLKPRLRNIARLLVPAVEEQRGVWPTDPAWLMGQIMAESFFYEFALSSSLAGGICQFIPPTAREYGMHCAGDKAEHAAAPFRFPELAGRIRLFFDQRDAKRKFKQNGRPEGELDLEQALRLLEQGRCGQRPVVKRQLDYLQRLRDFDEEIALSREEAKRYIEANVAGRDIFNPRDDSFLASFDPRLTHEAPIRAMAKMMATHLRKKGGNILVATAGYNAGLGNTEADGQYEPFGKLPAFGETTAYVSRILVNHYEITRRMESARKSGLQTPGATPHTDSRNKRTEPALPERRARNVLDQ